jgi:hypothetical protein
VGPGFSSLPPPGLNSKPVLVLRFSPGLLGSFLWYRPGLCHCPVSDSYIGLYRGANRQIFRPNQDLLPAKAVLLPSQAAAQLLPIFPSALLLSLTLTVVSRVSRQVAERVFAAILTRSVHSLCAHYLALSPAPAWLRHFSADCLAVLATVLSYSDKLPTVPPPSPPTLLRCLPPGGMKVSWTSSELVANQTHQGFGWEISSRGRFDTPARSL